MSVLGTIAHVGMTVRDMDTMVAFYRENFGFEVINSATLKHRFFQEAPEMYNVSEETICPFALLQQPGGGVMLELFQFIPQQDRIEVPWARPGIHHFAIATEHFDELYEKLKANGIQFCMNVSTYRSDKGKWVFFRDPEENLVEVFEPFKTVQK